MPFTNEAFFWQVAFADGSVLSEIDGFETCDRHPDYPHGHPGDPHALACIDRTDVSAIALMPVHEGLHRVVVILPEGKLARPVFIRRRGQHLNPNLGEYAESSITIVGYRYSDVAHRVHQVLTGVLEDGTLITTDDPQHLQPSAPAHWFDGDPGSGPLALPPGIE